MVDTEPRRERSNELIASRVRGTVKWFNAKSGYGFIIRDDTKEDLFVHQTVIVKNKPKKAIRTLSEGERVEFDVITSEKGVVASRVSAPRGSRVEKSPYAPERKKEEKSKCDTLYQRVHPEIRRDIVYRLPRTIEDEDLIGWCVIDSIPGPEVSEQYTDLRDEKSTARD